MEFKYPYPKGVEIHQLYIAFMFILLKRVYPRIDKGWVRITPVLEFLMGGEKHKMYRVISNSISLLSDVDTKFIPIEVIGNISTDH